MKIQKNQYRNLILQLYAMDSGNKLPFKFMKSLDGFSMYDLEIIMFKFQSIEP